MAPEADDRVTVLRVPQGYPVVRAARGDVLAVGAEAHAVDPLLAPAVQTRQRQPQQIIVFPVGQPSLAAQQRSMSLVELSTANHFFRLTKVQPILAELRERQLLPRLFPFLLDQPFLPRHFLQRLAPLL